MDGLVHELLRLESSTHKALVEIDASTYDSSVREQMRLLSVSRESVGVVSGVERLLGAQLQLRDQTIPGYLNQLDQLVYQITQQVNGIHFAACDLNGNTGIDFGLHPNRDDTAGCNGSRRQDLANLIT